MRRFCDMRAGFIYWSTKRIEGELLTGRAK